MTSDSDEFAVPFPFPFLFLFPSFLVLPLPQVFEFPSTGIVMQRRLDTLTHVHGTACHVWLVNTVRLSKCVFVPVLSQELEPIGAPFSVRG